MLGQFGGFQQEGAASVMDLLEGGQGRFVVGGQFRHHRHEVPFRGKGAEGIEVRLKMKRGHGWQKRTRRVDANAPPGKGRRNLMIRPAGSIDGHGGVDLLRPGTDASGDVDRIGEAEFLQGGDGLSAAASELAVDI